MAHFRTDLALEAAQALSGRADRALPGVTLREELLRGYPLTRVEITSPQGAEATGKPIGTYLTLELAPLFRREADAFPRGTEALASLLRELLPRDLKPEDPVLVVGLGNRLVTPDAVGPRATDQVLVTRHLVRSQPEHFAAFRPVAALAAGVLASTGVESGELVRAAAELVRPRCVIAVDALAARSARRLCTTLQLADTGIFPGSGIGNRREGLTRETLGIPVIALGVPTVVDGATLAADLTGDPARGAALGDFLVTPKDMDSKLEDLAKLIGYGLTLALQEGLRLEEAEMLLS